MKADCHRQDSTGVCVCVGGLGFLFEHVQQKYI